MLCEDFFWWNRYKPVMKMKKNSASQRSEAGNNDSYTFHKGKGICIQPQSILENLPIEFKMELFLTDARCIWKYASWRSSTTNQVFICNNCKTAERVTMHKKKLSRTCSNPVNLIWTPPSLVFLINQKKTGEEPQLVIWRAHLVDCTFAEQTLEGYYL